MEPSAPKGDVAVNVYAIDQSMQPIPPAGGVPQAGPTIGGDMPNVYVQPEVAQTGTVRPTSEVIDTAFLKSVNGLLKVVEMVFSLVTFICATVYYPFVPLGGGWVQFVSITAFMLSGVLYLIHFFRMPPKISASAPFKFIEFSYYAFYTLCYFIAAIVSAANGWRDGAVVAATVFSFFCWATFMASLYFRFMDWRQSSEGPYFSSVIAGMGSSSSAT